jgi:hypothetical protein
MTDQTKQGPKPKTFTDGIVEAAKLLDLFKNPYVHWVPAGSNQSAPHLAAAVPDLCRYKGKKRCHDCKGFMDIVYSEPGIISHILCKFEYPARNPLAMLGFDIEGEKSNPPTDRL